MENIYKVGVLGCANIAIRSLLPAFLKADRFQILAVASRQLDKAKELAGQYSCKAYGGYEELLEDPLVDLVYIPLPTGLHYEWVMKALHRHKHVISEKSLAADYGEVEELVQIARKNGLLLIENFQFRFHSQHQWVRDCLQRNEIGDIRCFRSSFGFPPFADSSNIRYSRKLGGGALLDAGAYTVKAMQVILPEYTFSLRAASLFRPFGAEVDIWGGAYFHCNDGIVAELAFGFDNYYQCNYEIWGSTGKLIVTRAFTAPTDLNPIIILEKQGYKEEFNLPKDDHFDNMLKYVTQCLDKREYEQEYAQNLAQSYYLCQIKQYCHEEE